MIKGMIGAVYIDSAAPVPDNVALLFNWTLEVEHRKAYTYGPELHGVPTDWYVKSEAYWATEKIQKGQFFVRLFIGKGKDVRCLAGNVEALALQKTDGINESAIRLNGIGLLSQEG
ncbi:MAG: hypothetical protein HPY74_20690 [Firmicutes bacterium]|nr:hypothetical protein [Bacillota bacterium]